jgi:hypothetical protein
MKRHHLKSEPVNTPIWRRLASTVSVAAAVVCAASLSTPAFAAKPVTDAELIRILAELRDQERDEFGKNVDRWKEVNELLKEYVKYSQAEEGRHKQWQQNQSMLGKEDKDKFLREFKQMTGGVRDVKGKGLADQALAAGLNEGKKPAPGGGGGTGGGAGGDVLATLGNLLSLNLAEVGNMRKLLETLGDPEFFKKALAVGSAKPQELTKALSDTYTMWSEQAVKDLEGTITNTLASRPEDKEAGQRLINAIQLIKLDSNKAGSDLRQVQATAKGSGNRLSTIEALMAQAAELGGTDAEGNPKFDNAKLAELRTYLTSVSAMQTEELIKLQTKEAGDRAEAELKLNGTKAKRISDSLARSSRTGAP